MSGESWPEGSGTCIRKQQKKANRGSGQRSFHHRVVQRRKGGNGELGAVGVGGSEGARERDEELELEGEDGFLFEESAPKQQHAEEANGFEVQQIHGGVRRPREGLLRGRGRLLLDLHGGLAALALFGGL